MSYAIHTREAEDFARRIHALGFPVYLADSGTYGLIASKDGSRVVSFQFDVTNSLSGNYAGSWLSSLTKSARLRMSRSC
jgi:hypothetical protein